MRKKAFPALVAFLLVSACSNGRVAVVPSSVLGPYTATGMVTATGTSLYRRGTHVLKINDRSRFFLESKTVDLNEYAGLNVVVEGEVEPNSYDRFLPVMVVDTIKKDSSKQSAAVMQTYRVPVLALSLQAPANWISDISAGRLTFRLDGEKKPFITVGTGDVDVLPEGLHVRIDGHDGIRFVDEEANQHHIYVRRGDGSVVLFSFVPQGEASTDLRGAFYTMMQSVSFVQNAVKKESAEDGAAPGGDGRPCGGPAGVVCPQGEYCAVLEMDTGIGMCRQIH